jgi:hypothetical protein
MLTRELNIFLLGSYTLCRKKTYYLNLNARLNNMVITICNVK